MNISFGLKKFRRTFFARGQAHALHGGGVVGGGGNFAQSGKKVVAGQSLSGQNTPPVEPTTVETVEIGRNSRNW